MLKIPRSVVMFSLVVLVVAAGYLVVTAGGLWEHLDFTAQTPDPVTPGLDDVKEEDEEAEETLFEENDPAEWQFSSGEEFFIEYRLERERVRSRELDVLNQMIDNPNISDEAKREAEQKLLDLHGLMETEMLVENAVKAQGYDNAVLILQNDAAFLIVSAGELSTPEVSLIIHIVMNSTDIAPDKINVTAQSGK
ncbi:MAG: SpoIIIAH-like family protein [Firmicutes bacterium]|nr:SpoIIIAH-like family protein [Bacillota bacterium]